MKTGPAHEFISNPLHSLKLTFSPPKILASKFGIPWLPRGGPYFQGRLLLVSREGTKNTQPFVDILTVLTCWVLFQVANGALGLEQVKLGGLLGRKKNPQRSVVDGVDGVDLSYPSKMV